MRILVVEPGPNFSVADVCRGWVDALRQLGHEVVSFNLADRLTFYETALGGTDGTRSAILAAEGLRAACYDFWPDLVVVVSAFFVPPFTLDAIRGRGHRLAVILTESPYEDDNQTAIAAHCDLAVVNDPTNLDAFRAVNPNTHYLPHAHDPARHHPRPAHAEHASDFCFVGTGYPERTAFLEAVDFTGIDVALGGNWAGLDTDSPLRKFIAHDIDVCLDNDQTAELYAATKVSANVYRTGAQRPGLADGWAMGPREVELAACGTFFLRESRPESDLVLPMLPTFDGPGDFAEKLRWWLAHDDNRHQAAERARTAVANRTFTHNARALLERVT